ncbi:MAG: radical SAM/SPASM domain-containing protein [Nanoarchaeota archaeon]|nr:radical SAM/SPASM domain-containing protein [Nanoarchaeota archaeon]
MKNKMKINEVRHMLTYDCILRCLHCYLSAGEHPEIKSMNFTQKRADEFYDFFKPESVSATGGEPLLKPDLIRILAKSTAKYGGALELVTNGILLKGDFVKELTDLNPQSFYQISLDGLEDFHDYLRQRKGSYQSAIKAIDLTSSLGRLTKARMTVTFENYKQIPKLIETLDKFERNNIKLVMRTALNTGRALKNKLSFGSDMIEPLQIYKEMAKNIGVSITDRCGYCLDSISVDPVGDIYPCCYFVFNPEYKMGNISNPIGLEENPDFANYTGKCFAVEKFSSSSPASRCESCTRDELIKTKKIV